MEKSNRNPSKVKEEAKAFKIYVGSIAGHIDQDNFLSYFSQFGSVNRLRMFFRDCSNKVNKGYCHLIIEEKSTYDRILTSGPHYYNGRRIYCSPLKSGRRLEKHNQFSNTKRVILRNIPQDMTEGELYKLASGYGDIEMAYIFKAHGMMKKNYFFAPTASVQFVQAASANALVQMHQVEVDFKGSKVTLLVYPYIHNYNDLKDVVNNTPKENLMQQLGSKFVNKLYSTNQDNLDLILKEELILKLKQKQEQEKRMIEKGEVKLEMDVARYACKPTNKKYRVGILDKECTKPEDKYEFQCTRVNPTLENRTSHPPQANSNNSALITPLTNTPRTDERVAKKGFMFPQVKLSSGHLGSDLVGDLYQNIQKEIRQSVVNNYQSNTSRQVSCREKNTSRYFSLQGRRLEAFKTQNSRDLDPHLDNCQLF